MKKRILIEGTIHTVHFNDTGRNGSKSIVAHIVLDTTSYINRRAHGATNKKAITALAQKLGGKVVK